MLLFLYLQILKNGGDMEIKGFQEVSFLDWAGKNSAIIFLNRCNFRCTYCHNRQLAIGIDGQNIPPSYVLSKLSTKKDWIDGIVISGGEPTLNRTLVEFCRDIRTFLDIGIKLDTNGSNPYLLEILINENLLDYVSMDIKAPLDQEKYKEIVKANIDIEKIEKSIHLICEGKVKYEFRTTVATNLLSEKDILQIIQELTCISNPIKEYTIQNFKLPDIADKKLEKLNLNPYPADTLKQIRHKILNNYDVLKCNIKN